MAAEAGHHEILDRGLAIMGLDLPPEARERLVDT